MESNVRNLLRRYSIHVLSVSGRSKIPRFSLSKFIPESLRDIR